MVDDVKPSDESLSSLQTKLDELNKENKQPSTTDKAVNDEQPVLPITSDKKVDFTIDENQEDSSVTKDLAEETNKIDGKKSWKDKLNLKWPPGKKESIIIAIAILVIGSLLAFLILHKSPKPAYHKAQIIKVAPKPILVPSTLSGLPVAPSVNKQPVTGVMIENTDQARPQSGLSQAGVVMEAIAEGGITRFLALYQDTAPASVGPVRSARPYYLQWALGFDAAVAHDGGSPDALSDITAWGVKDLNEAYNAGSFNRISSRAAPHNLYTSIAQLNQLEASKGYGAPTFTGFSRKAESPAKVPTAKTVGFNISWSDYAVHYDYNSASNSYNRSEGGAGMVDANAATPISPKVVIGLIVPLSSGALDSTGAYYSNYGVVGNGQAYIFQDGTVTVGQWAKTSPASQINFTTTSGQTIQLDPGQTWITALANSNLVSYSP